MKLEEAVTSMSPMQAKIYIIIDDPGVNISKIDTLFVIYVRPAWRWVNYFLANITMIEVVIFDVILNVYIPLIASNSML